MNVFSLTYNYKFLFHILKCIEMKQVQIGDSPCSRSHRIAHLLTNRLTNNHNKKHIYNSHYK